MTYLSRLLRLYPTPMQGPDVLEIQERLTQLGYDAGTADGLFGVHTEEAVKHFQQSRRLEMDGIVGPETWKELMAGNQLLRPRISIGNNSQRSTGIQIDLKSKFLYFSSSQLEKKYPVAIGKPSTPTPVGNWQIVQKALNPGGPFGTRWMRLSIPWGGYGIHGTNNPDSIGTAASHGCVRMYNKDVEELYNMVLLGTPVSIIGDTPSRTLLSGSRGPDVKALQEMLIDLLYLTSPADGIFGPATNKAVNQFQIDYQLKADGIAGPKTMKKLKIVHELKVADTQP